LRTTIFINLHFVWKIVVEKDLKNIFRDFESKASLFTDKGVLQSAFIPENVLHRDSELQQVAGILGTCLRGERPSNLFIYGKTGTGKTVTTKILINQLTRVAQKSGRKIQLLYLNCKLKKIADTEYRLIAQLGRELGKEIPITGLPTDEVYKQFYASVDAEPQTLILVLDEIDQLIKKTGDGVLYNLTRMNEELTRARVSIVGISNDLTFTNNLDPRAKSSLSEEEVVFPPYNAIQLQDILRDRASLAFKSGVLGEGVIEKCAAYAAREHGDARRALELLRVAAEIAERNNELLVMTSHIDLAEKKMEDQGVMDLVKTQPRQFQVSLYSILLLSSKKKDGVFTGEVYELYKQLCEKIHLPPLTQRRVSDIIAELDMMGIVNAKVLSKGRYGRTREIHLSIPLSTSEKVKHALSEYLCI